MRFYIAGAISRYAPNYERVRHEFGIIEDILLSRGFLVANPWKILPYDPSLKWLDYMVALLPELLKCDGIVLRRDWWLSRGARIELVNAILFHKEIISEASVYRLRGLL